VLAVEQQARETAAAVAKAQAEQHAREGCGNGSS